ncbi:uncharacterized protein M6B38_285330 [Iris pallida]|uniref:MAPK kinase substrate protein n=1 Tax=Iris pallida TaxID=29817 RepID=A0AAX6I1S2_IRIPA|nr:uncharacterized protein M6B38_105015 [Iris pallida]KAJ6847199.1 uncharacterized protein M6B38_285330 [Iris pallida]
MAALQRSGETFRRSGSSGLVWEDRFLPGEMDSNKAAAAAKKKEEEEEQKQQDQPEAELRHSRSVGSIGMLERNQSNGGRGYRSRVSPAVDPPSPKPSGCCFGIFGKTEPVSKNKPKAKPQHRPARR